MSGDDEPIRTARFPTDPGAESTDSIVAIDATDEDARAILDRRLPSLVRVWSPGDTAVVIHPLAGARTDIGRGVTGPHEIRVDGDTRVSRRHARVTWDTSTGALAVEDKSAHGTFRNGERVDRESLHDGDVLRMGDTFFIVRWQPALGRDDEVPGLLGAAPLVRELRRQLALVAPTPAWVMLLGETGSGKEVSARALHALSGRDGPFVAVNCSAIPESLAESQLFGHRKGAFTGAEKDHAGYFEQADGGTLFLDELGELTSALQPKLLRALDENRVTRLGETEPRDVDVRVVAATNRDLSSAMDAGQFRPDLYARLADITLRLPSLRERREDVVPLLLDALSMESPRLSAGLVSLLLLHDWPHNVRELRKVATELSVRGKGEDVLSRRLVAERFGITSFAPTPAPRRAASSPSAESATPSREALVELLERHGGNVTEVARETGRSRKQVYRWLDKHDLSPESFRSEL